MTDDIQSLTPTEYVAALKAEQESTDPRVLEAYALQEKMQQAKKLYENYKDQLHELLSQVGPYKNEYYSVSNLKRAPRKIDMTLLRRNFPDLVERAEPSEKYIIQALVEEFGRETLLRMARDHNPQAYDDARTLSIAEFDKATGDSSKKFMYAGAAYQERWIEDKNEPLSITYLGKTLLSQCRGNHSSYLRASGEEED